MESILIHFKLIILRTLLVDLQQPMTAVGKYLTSAQVQAAYIITLFLESRMSLVIQKQNQRTILSASGSALPKRFFSIFLLCNFLGEIHFRHHRVLYGNESHSQMCYQSMFLRLRMI
nr:MAG TPA: hypothetical protein [Caudoviricetes sp.]